jgi:oxygen-independent coproporphyrinogen-3 oxidase
MSSYISCLEEEITEAETLAQRLGARFDGHVDSIYLGGGTPTTLNEGDLARIFQRIRSQFQVSKDAEITVECAPGTLSNQIIEVLLEVGCNRLSLGTQSFVDHEVRSVGRLHTPGQARADVATLHAAGVRNINLDLIAGLPHQTMESWRASLNAVAELEVPHASVYMLEVDEDSRLGREMIAGGERYHAHHVPDSDLSADLYLEAIDFLAAVGLTQYEVSNFSRPGFESKHNLKYWSRQPYVGFGLDAHSMLPARERSLSLEAIRFGNTDDLDTYIAGSAEPFVERIDTNRAVEESMFLGLRLNRGIDLADLPADAKAAVADEIRELEELALVECSGSVVRLTQRGRLLSNEVFERFVSVTA